MNKELIEFYKKEYKLKTGRDLFKDVIDYDNPNFINSPEYWLKKVSSHFGVPKERILSRSRLKIHSVPRRWFYYACYMNGLSQGDIAKFIGRDRSVVSQLVAAFSKKQAKQKDFKKIENELFKHTS